jgi:Cu/Ag efflux pump CusA
MAPLNEEVILYMPTTLPGISVTEAQRLMETQERISWDELIAEMDRAIKIPGCVNGFTMPIKARIDMLSTGMRTPVGIKVFGANTEEIERVVCLLPVYPGNTMTRVLKGATTAHVVQYVLGVTSRNWMSGRVMGPCPVGR